MLKQKLNSMRILNQINLINISKIISSMKLNKFVKDIETQIGKKLLHDSIIMEGFVDIVNGDNIIHAKNSVVDQGLIAIINYLAGYRISGYWLGSASMTMYVGSDISTSTTSGMTALAKSLGPTPGTPPSSGTSGVTSGSPGQWQVQWTATWNPNTTNITGTLGEVALYLQIPQTLQPYRTDMIGNGVYMFSRMASADGKFTSIPSINTSVPLSIAWTFVLTYAK